MPCKPNPDSNPDSNPEPNPTQSGTNWPQNGQDSQKNPEIMSRNLCKTPSNGTELKALNPMYHQPNPEPNPNQSRPSYTLKIPKHRKRRPKTPVKMYRIELKPLNPIPRKPKPTQNPTHNPRGINQPTNKSTLDVIWKDQSQITQALLHSVSPSWFPNGFSTGFQQVSNGFPTGLTGFHVLLNGVNGNHSFPERKLGGVLHIYTKH